jgi:hypothetical protein
VYRKILPKISRWKKILLKMPDFCVKTFPEARRSAGPKIERGMRNEIHWDREKG